MKRKSKRRIQEDRIYYKVRSEYLAAHPVCEVCGVAKSKDIHHKAGRYSGNYTNVATFMAVCRPCHDYIHAHPKEARERELLI